MKKILVLFIVITLCLLTLTSCLFDKREKNTFFSEEALAHNSLLGMPEPNLENSYLVEDGTLYLNLTDEEYAAYVEQLAKFLVEKEDIHTPAYAYGFGCEVIFFLTFYEYAPLEYLTEYDGAGHVFIFSTDGEVAPDSYYGEYELVGITKLSQPERLKYTNFTYNTVLTLNPSTGMTTGQKFVPCDYDRHYPEDAGEYIIAGTNEYCGVQKCKYCGEMTTDLDGESRRYNNITYLGSRGYLGVAPTSWMNATLCELRAYVIEGVGYKVYANGIELPVTAEYEDYIEYKFVMPDTAVEIEIEVISEDESRPVISSFEGAFEWLRELRAEDVASLTVVSDPYQAKNGMLRTHEKAVDADVISYEIERYRTAELVLTGIPSSEDASTGSVTRAIFELNDGTKYEFTVNGNVFSYGGREYMTSDVPYIGIYTSTEESFSFVSEEMGALYDNYTDELICEADISSLEFVRYLGGIDDSVPEYRIETDFGTIYIHESEIFSLVKDGTTTAYQLTKGNLLDLIER